MLSMDSKRSSLSDVPRLRRFCKGGVLNSRASIYSHVAHYHVRQFVAMCVSVLVEAVHNWKVETVELHLATIAADYGAAATRVDGARPCPVLCLSDRAQADSIVTTEEQTAV